jgi:hypothetical protein
MALDMKPKAQIMKEIISWTSLKLKFSVKRPPKGQDKSQTRRNIYKKPIL